MLRLGEVWRRVVLRSIGYISFVGCSDVTPTLIAPRPLRVRVEQSYPSYSTYIVHNLRSYYTS
jgi:hypothetical protein